LVFFKDHIKKNTAVSSLLKITAYILLAAVTLPGIVMHTLADRTVDMGNVVNNIEEYSFINFLASWDNRPSEEKDAETFKTGFINEKQRIYFKINFNSAGIFRDFKLSVIYPGNDLTAAFAKVDFSDIASTVYPFNGADDGERLINLSPVIYYGKEAGGCIGVSFDPSPYGREYFFGREVTLVLEGNHEVNGGTVPVRLERTLTADLKSGTAAEINYGISGCFPGNAKMPDKRFNDASKTYVICSLTLSAPLSTAAAEKAVLSFKADPINSTGPSAAWLLDGGKALDATGIKIAEGGFALNDSGGFTAVLESAAENKPFLLSGGLALNLVFEYPNTEWRD